MADKRSSLREKARINKMAEDMVREIEVYEVITPKVRKNLIKIFKGRN